MTSFSKMKIGLKLGLGFGSVLLLMIVLGIFSVLQLSKINGSTVDIATNWLPSVKVLGDIRYIISTERRFELYHAMRTNRKDEEGDESGMSKQKDLLAEAEKKYQPMITSQDERKLYEEFRDLWSKRLEIEQHVIELSTAGKKAEARDIMVGPERAAFDAVADKLHEDEELNNKGADVSTQSAASVFSSSRYWVIGILMGAVALGSFIAFSLARSISSSARSMLGVIQEVADKNLTVKDMKIVSEDEVGMAGAALNQMKNGLHEMIQSIRESAEQVAASTQELSATGQQITANSEETTAQARVVSEAGNQVNTNLQTLASGAEEMNSTIADIAKNATEAARVAGEAVEAAESANQTVSRLGESSVEIEKVIEVITSIAQQTNLLALNATIEAARAGEAGKGFAVVANEVKELAKQTAKATEEIKQKISVIRENTGGAVEAIGGIKGVIDKVSQISTTIATAVEEQSATTSEMARNVTEAANGASTIASNIKGVAEAAQSTSTNVGESQTATEHLSRTANDLRDLVGQFKTSSRSDQEKNQASLLKAAHHAVGR